MYSKSFLDLECYFPRKPEKWTEPLDDEEIGWYKGYGWLDENGRITEKGWDAGIRPENLTGKETEEHYLRRLNAWKEKVKIFNKWYEEKWEKGEFKYDLPFPKKEFDNVKYDDLPYPY